MKTAEEWMKLQEPKALQPAALLVVNRQIIREIQLDAMKEGARRAAEMARNHLHGTASGWVNITKRGETVNNVILTAAEQWTVSDL